jgi:hypothetical protein
VRTGSGTQQSDDATPDRSTGNTGDDRDDEVKAVGKVEVEADEAREDRGDDDLATCADVEQANAEREGDTETGRDERGREVQRVGERLDPGGESVNPEVEDRALEQRAVGT